VAGFAGAELKNLSRITGKYENKLWDVTPYN
jgi:hypothetical protein